MFRLKFISAAIAAVALLAAPSVSRAAFTLTIEQTAGSPPPGGWSGDPVYGSYGGGNGNPLTVQDNVGVAPAPTVNGVIFDNNAAVGAIALAQLSNGVASDVVQFGQFTLDGLLGREGTHPDSLRGQQNQLSVSNTGTSVATLVITLTENNFTTPGTGQYQVLNSLSINQYSGNSADLRLLSNTVVTDNGGSGNSTTIDNSIIGPLGGDVPPLNPPSHSSQGSWNRTASSFTLQHQVTLTIDAGASVQFQAFSEVIPVSAVPAPAGLVLFATALPFAGLLRLRRRLTGAAA